MFNKEKSITIVTSPDIQMRHKYIRGSLGHVTCINSHEKIPNFLIYINPKTNKNQITNRCSRQFIKIYCINKTQYTATLHPTMI